MPTCPLCESSQPLGDACDVCGRPFPAGEALPVRIPRLADLEPTLRDAAGPVPVERMAELEATGDGGAGIVAGGLVDGFAPTAEASVDVVVEPLEVERTGQDAAPDEPAGLAALRCRYCLTPATAGQRLCARCGMRLPLDRPAPVAAVAAEAPCTDCGIPFAGSQCPACGARRA